jgi:predicted glutamine amidotransferase
MCRLYGFRANEPTKVECTLVYAQNALMVQSREDLTGRGNAHGWGIATYEDHCP